MEDAGGQGGRGGTPGGGGGWWLAPYSARRGGEGQGNIHYRFSPLRGHNKVSYLGPGAGRPRQCRGVCLQ